MTKCERRGLWIRPNLDCGRCHWYECEQHPDHSAWPAIKRILAECPTMRRSRLDCRGKKIEWDGTQKHCARFNAFGKGKSGHEDPCVNCTLRRPCEHRKGEPLATMRTHQGRADCNGDHYITETGKRFKVRIRQNGKQITVGTYGTVEEARTARDAALLKSYQKNADVT